MKENIDFKKCQNITFDYYMVDYNNITKSTFRLLEVNNRVVLPTQTNIRLLITAEDVLQSWSVSSLGVHIDACPGCVSQVSLFLKRSGVYYGQCSEICGVNHGFIPIGIVGINFYMSENQSSRDFDPLLSIFFEDNSKDINL